MQTDAHRPQYTIWSSSSKDRDGVLPPAVRRGDIVTAAASSDYGKPRPALIIQHDLYAALPSVTVLPLTSFQDDAPLLRITIQPDDENGLKTPSQVMVDKILTLPRARIGVAIRRIDVETSAAVDLALRRFLNLPAYPGAGGL